MAQQQAAATQDTEEIQGEGFSLETVQQLEQHGAQAPSLGSIISWGIKNVILSEAELRRLLDNHGLQDVKIPQIRKRKALNRALKEMVEDELIRLVADNAQKITYVVVKLSNDAELEDVLFNKTLKLTYRKDAALGTDPLTFSSAAAEHTLRPLIEKYQSCYVSSDISRLSCSSRSSSAVASPCGPRAACTSFRLRTMIRCSLCGASWRSWGKRRTRWPTFLCLTSLTTATPRPTCSGMPTMR